MMTKQIDQTIAEEPLGFPFGFLATALGEAINDSDIKLSTYTEMLTKDETIVSGLEFFINHALNYVGDYTHPNEEIQDFIKLNFENIETSYQETLEQFLINLLAYGFAVMEKVYEEKDGKIMLKRLVSLPSDTVKFVLENGEITKVKQITLGKGIVEIPRWKCIITTIGTGIYGESRLRRVYRMYAFKKSVIKFWAIAMERYAMPIAYGKARDTSKLKEALAKIWSSGVLVTDPESEVQLLESKSGLGDVYKQAIDFANVLIYRGLLLPQLLSSASNVGSYALGKIHLDLFLQSVLSFSNKIQNILIDQLVADLIDLNFSEVESYGKFVFHNQLDTDQLESLSRALLNFVNIGVVDFDDADWIRAMVGFPEKKEPETDEAQGLEEDVWQSIEDSLKLTKGQKE